MRSMWPSMLVEMDYILSFVEDIWLVFKAIIFSCFFIVFYSYSSRYSWGVGWF